VNSRAKSRLETSTKDRRLPAPDILAAYGPARLRSRDDAPMGRVYALVILCHAAVITILWWFGRAFSR
jgi:hypothetical protein